MFSQKIFRYFCTRNPSTVDAKEIELFSKISTEWWNETGALKPLHSFNKLRIPFIREGLIQNGCINKVNINTPKPLKGLKILDVGCGGGILSEPLSRLGAEVTGLDADSNAIESAKMHAIKAKLNINYLTSSIEQHSEENAEVYDAIVASEIIEHVTNKDIFIESCVKCLKNNGAFFITTMNQTFLADILGIKVAECLGVVPQGTHEIEKFIKPHDLQRILEQNNCRTKLVHGMKYFYFTNTWSWTSDTTINYGLHAVKLN